MTGEEYRQLINKLMGIARSRSDAKALADAFEIVKAYDEQSRLEVFDAEGRSVILSDLTDGSIDAHGYSTQIRRLAEEMLASGRSEYVSTLLDIELESLFFDAPYDFDAFCRFLESERDERARFYEPRRKQLYPLAMSLQQLEMGIIKRLLISMPPGTGKTTLAIFFVCWTSGRHPEMQSIIGSHSNEFVRGVYDEILRILSPSGEYLWNRVFPHVGVAGTNAKNLRIDLGKRKRFETIELVSIKAALAGKVRATNLIYGDDYVEGSEQASSRERMDELFRKVTTDVLQRGQGPSIKHLMIATRWTPFDVIGRMESIYGGRPDTRVINLPVKDPVTGKSNFFYPYNLGYDDKTIAEIEEAIDPTDFKALYMGQPIFREGQLYPEEELQRYFELPDPAVVEPDAILAVCDTKTTGSDYCVLPVVYQYGDKFYVEDVVCENYAPDVVETSVVQMLLKHKVQAAQFESNVAGGKMAQVCQQRIDEAGGRTHITTKWTQANKETKIQVNAAWVKKHCLFKDNSVIKGSEWAEYRLMLRQLTQYTLMGKNKHDDVPDAFAQLALYIDGKVKAKLKLEKRWF